MRDPEFDAMIEAIESDAYPEIIDRIDKYMPSLSSDHDMQAQPMTKRQLHVLLAHIGDQAELRLTDAQKKARDLS